MSPRIYTFIIITLLVIALASQILYNYLALNYWEKGETIETSNDFSFEKTVPSIEYEESLRKIDRNINDLWLYLRDKLNSSQIKFFNELRYSLSTDIKVIADRDQRWRTKKLNQLTELIFNRINKIQSPSDCKSARKLICELDPSSGFGGAAHHWANCLIASLALNRTFIFSRNESKFRNFKPLSETCLDSSGKNTTTWGHPKQDSYQVIKLPLIRTILLKHPTPYYSPPRIPRQLENQLRLLSNEPYVLFVGIVFRYVLRTNNEFNEYLEKYKTNVQFKHPVVGIHVRRTDKLNNEAKYHSLDEYMTYAEDFYDKIDLMNERNGLKIKTKRLIYLATDELSVWQKEVNPWLKKGYQFFENMNHSKTAVPELRGSNDSMRDLLVDVFMLSECDFIVCGLSSTFCRIAVQLMHARDPSLPYQTVDKTFSYCIQPYHKLRAIVGNKEEVEQELSFKAGDVLTIDKYCVSNQMDGYYREGYRYGKLLKKNTESETIKFPNFKVEEYLETYESLAFD